jgi:hypothetical protein
MQGEESLDFKCTWRRGYRGRHRRSQRLFKSGDILVSHGKENEVAAPSSTSPWHNCFVFATSKASGHSLTGCLNAKVFKAVAESCTHCLFFSQHWELITKMLPLCPAIWSTISGRKRNLPSSLFSPAWFPCQPSLTILSFLHYTYVHTHVYTHMQAHTCSGKISEEDAGETVAVE